MYGRLKPRLYYRHWFYISNNVIHSCVQYDSGDEVDHTNVESFIEKEVQKIRDKGLSCYYKGGSSNARTALSQSPGMGSMSIFWIMHGLYRSAGTTQRSGR